MRRSISADADMNHFLSLVISQVGEYFSISEDEAEELVRKYYFLFLDKSFCDEIGIPVQDDDFLFHEGVGGVALRVYYYIFLKGNPDPYEFLRWQADFYRN